MKYRWSVVALLLSGCGSSVTTPTDTDDRTATVAAYQQARGRWAAAGPASYTYRFQRSCFCAPPYTAPVVLTVQDRRVARAVFAETGAPVDAEGYPAVDELFAQIGEAITEDAYLIRVSYDPALGYPTEVYVDRSPQIADEELSLSASELVPAGT